MMILLLATWLTATAQQAVNMKFGKPTDEEMKMTVYAADSSAEAVMLCKLTDVTYTIQQSSFLVDYKERFRIKVLKPEGAASPRWSYLISNTWLSIASVVRKSRPCHFPSPAAALIPISREKGFP